MNGYLRQSTASQARAIGPFLDDTDFKTAETALTIANTDVKLRANGTTLSNKNSGGGTHQVNGLYSLTFDATDTANVGELYFSVVVAGALPVFGTYVVLEEAVYDALFAASAAGFGTAQTGDAFARLGAPAGASVSADIAAVKTETASIQADTNDIQTRLPAALVSGRMDSSIGAVAAGAIAAASFAAGAFDAVWTVAARILTAGTNIVLAKGTGVTGFNDLSAAQVNAEVLDVLTVDTFTQPAQGAPPATTTILNMLRYQYKAWRNRLTQTATTYSLFADDQVTVDHKATISNDGVTFQKGQVTSGP